MDSKATLGERLRAARKAVKMTQQELADKTGIALSSIKLYESGKREPRIDQARKIADALGIPLSGLTGETEGIKTLGQIIRERREKEGMTQQEFSLKTGIALRLIKRYENDMIQPSIERSKKIADALGVGLGYLLIGDAPMKTLLERMLNASVVRGSDGKVFDTPTPQIRSDILREMLLSYFEKLNEKRKMNVALYALEQLHLPPDADGEQ